MWNNDIALQVWELVYLLYTTESNFNKNNVTEI